MRTADSMYTTTHNAGSATKNRTYTPRHLQPDRAWLSESRYYGFAHKCIGIVVGVCHVDQGYLHSHIMNGKIFPVQLKICLKFMRRRYPSLSCIQTNLHVKHTLTGVQVHCNLCKQAACPAVMRENTTSSLVDVISSY